MSDKHNKKRAQWHAENYVQVKISVKPHLAESFKFACKANNVSIAGVLSQFMNEYINEPVSKETPVVLDYSTRRKRKAAAQKCFKILEQLRDVEETSRDNIPENLQGSVNYERADATLQALDEALEKITEAYE